MIAGSRHGINGSLAFLLLLLPKKNITIPSIKATNSPDKNKIIFSLSDSSNPFIAKYSPSASPIPSPEKYDIKNIISPNAMENSKSINLAIVILSLLIPTVISAATA